MTPGPRPPAAPPVVVEALTKRYGPTAALDDVDLEVGGGRFTVLLGPSGSGKTTLLRCIAGIERATAGRIRIGGTVVADPRRHVPPEQRDLAMVFQDYALWPHMTVEQNVAYALRRRHLDGTVSRRRTRELLDRVGLGRMAQRYPSQLSGGEQQRVALARALVAEPGLLLFDEPLSNLDADLRERMRVEIATLVRDLAPTAVYITHDQAEAFALADDVGVLEGGRVVQVGTPEAIYLHPATAFVARFTGLAGELPAEVGRSLAGGLVEVVALLQERVPLTARAPRPVAAGLATPLLVRAAAVSLHPTSREELGLRGRVRDVAFRGRGYDHVVELASGPQLSGVFAPRRWARDELVRLALDPQGCLVLGEDGGAAAPRLGTQARTPGAVPSRPAPDDRLMGAVR